MALTVNLHPIDDQADGDLVLFDQIEYGFMLRLAVPDDRPRARLVAGLTAASLLRAGHHSAGPLRLVVEVPIRDFGIGTGKAVLYVTEIDRGIVITSASTIRMNLQHVLRVRHGIADASISLDGKRNFSKPTAECDESDLEVQLETIGRCVDRLRDTILASLPGSTIAEGRLQLRRAEVCHDLACTNAIDCARATCRVPIAGSRGSSSTEYAIAVEGGRTPTWRFTTSGRGPIRKGYAKLRELLRTELSCPHRDAVVRCVGYRNEAPFSFDGAVGLALEFYHAAGALCCETLDHVRAVTQGSRTVQQLLATLGELTAIAEQQRVEGGYRPSDAAAQEAQRVLNAILSDGIVHARGLRKGTKVRDALERLVAPGGSLVRGASPGVFCLAPQFGLALPGWEAGHLREAVKR